MSEFKSHQALPSYGQWRDFCTMRRKTERGNCCIHCIASLAWATTAQIIIGARIKLWDEQVIPHSDGTEEVKLTSRTVGVTMRGQGCSDCQHLLLLAQAAEMERYEQANKQWCERNKPKVTSIDISVEVGNKHYTLLGDAWYDHRHVQVPTSMNNELYTEYTKTSRKAIVQALEPWMVAMGFTTPLAPVTADKPIRSGIPSRRVAYLDMTENVLRIAKHHTSRDTSTPHTDELVQE